MGYEIPLFGSASLLVLRFGSILYFPSPEKLLILRRTEWKMRVHRQLLSVLEAAFLLRDHRSQKALVRLLRAAAGSAGEHRVAEWQ